MVDIRAAATSILSPVIEGSPFSAREIALATAAPGLLPPDYSKHGRCRHRRWKCAPQADHYSANPQMARRSRIHPCRSSSVIRNFHQRVALTVIASDPTQENSIREVGRNGILASSPTFSRGVASVSSLNPDPHRSRERMRDRFIPANVVCSDQPVSKRANVRVKYRVGLSALAW